MTISQLSVSGGALATTARGDDEGPLLICSPGIGDSRDAFDPLAGILASSGYRVVSIDLRGHGESDTGFAAYGDEATADDLLRAIDVLGGGPAVLVGASLSAASATIAAGREPGRVAGLILIGPFLRNGGSPVMRGLLRLALKRPWGPAVWRTYAAGLWPGLGEDAVDRAAETTRNLREPGRWEAFERTARSDHRVVSPWIPRVTAPSLVVMGDADPDWKDPLAEAEWVCDQLGSQLFMVKGAGHAPMLEKPDEVAGAVLSFLREIRHG
ncbi:alpha/beta fold hydrolase [Corynebacterium pacaense]|uniref:alpha/beta fold hydrolase n=1 Tax=Corynebacterium pacaense TaxID=1816684 RepID=UPI0009BAC51A|nr:alpha/beta hydrolase [Corynebacterium pacaense]